ncbi:MAG: hypothetical protein IJG09_04905 [Methanobrevibacter sp.]|nr:hypothetical protein [Methanobrevibacter sp.]
MKKSYLTIVIVIILIAILGCVFLSYPSTDSSTGVKTTIEVCVDSPIKMSVFVNEIKNHLYFEGYDNDTLAWLESLDVNYMVFSSNGSYYIMTQTDASKLPVEFATDVSIYDVCECEIVSKKPLGFNLGEVILVKNVEFKEQNIQYYDV